MRTHILLAILAAAGLAGQAVRGADWIVARSYYTHDPQSGQRVTQYTPIGPFYSYTRTDYLRSGYRHTRSSIQAGGSADHMHIVEEYGAAVRPYGEWRFPYRPYSVPYGLWGAPFAGLGVYPYQPYGAERVPYGDAGGPGGYNQREPWWDGAYPDFGNRPRQPWPHPHPGGGAYRGGAQPGGPAPGGPYPGGPYPGSPGMGRPGAGAPRPAPHAAPAPAAKGGGSA